MGDSATAVRQQALTGTGFERQRKQTRRDRFLQQMHRVVPWRRLVELVAPYYPTGERGWLQAALEDVFRLYCPAHWNNRSGPVPEEAFSTIGPLVAILPSPMRACCDRPDGQYGNQGSPPKRGTDVRLGEYI